MRGYFNSNFPNRPVPNFPEVSGLRTQYSARETDSPNRVHYKQQDQSAQITALMSNVRQLQSTLNRLRIRSGATTFTGFKWQEPNKELDPTVFVAKDTWVYISPLNLLVTAGMTDIVTNDTVISCEGTWIAAQDVPAASGGKYNVPVFPYPSGMGVTIPSGAPLSGDLDSTTIFWIYRGAVQC